MDRSEIDHGSTMGRPWVDHGSTMGRPWVGHGSTMVDHRSSYTPVSSGETLMENRTEADVQSFVILGIGAQD